MNTALKTETPGSLFEAKNIIIRKHDVIGTLEIKIKGFVKGDDFRNALNKALAFSRQQGLFQWLLNFGDLGVIPKEDVEWAEHVWGPQWIKCGLRTVVVVEPMQVFGKLSLKKIITREAMQSMDMKFYMDFDKAWRVINEN